MKRTTLLSLSIIVSLLSYSCQRMGTESEIDALPTESKSLYESLQNFNSNYKETVLPLSQEVELRGRGFWSRLGDALVVSSADILGAAAGAMAVKETALLVGAATGGTGFYVVAGTAAVITGGGASVQAYREFVELRSSAMDTNQKDFRVNQISGELNIIYPDRYSELSNVGVEHNKYLTYLTNEISLRASEYENSIEHALKNDPSFISLNDKVISEIRKVYDSNGDIYQLINNFERLGLINKKTSSVLGIFMDIYIELKNGDNIEDVVNFYIKTISETDYLNEEEKQALICSFSVASESPYAWVYGVES